MEIEQAADFVVYYDASSPRGLLFMAMVILTALIVLAIAIAIWRRRNR